jgi:predicted secreted acid phosphatase
MKLIRWSGLVLLAAGLHLAAPAAEPLNLSTAKAEVLRYVETGTYERDIVNVADEAKAWLTDRASQRRAGEKLALVLDIDETALSNLPHMQEMDFGYLPTMWDEWVAEATAQPLGPVLDLYRQARRLDVAVFFITGRKESDRPGTERNLRAVGYGDYVRLLMKPNDTRTVTRVFKTEARRELERAGWIIIANVGDQVSDLEGGAAEKTFKLPNPFYRIE